MNTIENTSEKVKRSTESISPFLGKNATVKKYPGMIKTIAKAINPRIISIILMKILRKGFKKVVFLIKIV